MRDSVALPTAEDWGLLDGPVSLVEALNAALVEALEEIKSGAHSNWGEMGAAIYGRLKVLAIAYPDAGIGDSEVRATVARFMAINNHPSLFDFFRYHEW